MKNDDINHFLPVDCLSSSLAMHPNDDDHDDDTNDR